MKSPHECQSIDEVRHLIDDIDRQIIAALGLRFECVKAIMRFKQTEEDVRAPQRYQAVLAQRRLWAQETGLPPDLIEEMYRLLIDRFIDYELKTLADAPAPNEAGRT
jgi:isochorismate pyruvate lyase